MARMEFAGLEQDLMDQAGIIAKRWGFGEPLGRVFMAMLVSEKPLSQKALAESTGYSLSLVSPTLRILESLKTVRSLRGEGKERLYEPIVSFIEWISIMVKEFLDRDVRPALQKLEEIDSSELEKRKNLMKVAKNFRTLEFVFTKFDSLLLMKRATEAKIKRLLK